MLGWFRRELRIFRGSELPKRPFKLIVDDDEYDDIACEEWSQLDRQQVHARHYRMCESQPAQIDCRKNDCAFHKEGSCSNAAPAITLNEDGTFVCWSKAEKES